MHKSTVVAVTVDALASLATVIEQRERYLGALIALSAYQPGPGDPMPRVTLLTFARTTPPGRPVHVERFDAAPPATRDGSETVCIGECLCGQRLVSVVVYRER